MNGATESPIHLGHLVGIQQQQWGITALPQCGSQTYATLVEVRNSTSSSFRKITPPASLQSIGKEQLIQCRDWKEQC